MLNTKIKHNITRLLLEKMLEAGVVAIDVFFPPQYSFTRPSRYLFGLDTYPKTSPQSVSATLSRLKQRGLIKRQGPKQHSKWSLTPEGKKYVTKLPNILKCLPADGIPRIVMFDIPEKEKKKRHQLRGQLIAQNYTMLQKSVWVGYGPLSRDFMTYLTKLDLRKNVRILSLRKKGTIKTD